MEFHIVNFRLYLIYCNNLLLCNVKIIMQNNIAYILKLKFLSNNKYVINIKVIKKIIHYNQLKRLVHLKNNADIPAGDKQSGAIYICHEGIAGARSTLHLETTWTYSGIQEHKFSYDEAHPSSHDIKTICH